MFDYWVLGIGIYLVIVSWLLVINRGLGFMV